MELEGLKKQTLRPRYNNLPEEQREEVGVFRN